MFACSSMVSNSSPASKACSLKVPKHEIFGSGAFIQSKAVSEHDVRTGFYISSGKLLAILYFFA
jgi:hypothetical protein